MDAHVLLIGIVLALVCCINFDFTNAQKKEMTCQEAMAEGTKRQMEGVKFCNKNLVFNGEAKDRMNCLMKCVLKKEKLLNEDGKFDEGSITRMLEEEVPENFRPKVVPIFTECKEKHGPLLDDTEVSCKSYGALIKCLMGMMSICS